MTKTDLKRSPKLPPDHTGLTGLKTLTAQIQYLPSWLFYSLSRNPSNAISGLYSCLDPAEETEFSGAKDIKTGGRGLFRNTVTPVWFQQGAVYTDQHSGRHPLVSRHALAHSV